MYPRPGHDEPGLLGQLSHRRRASRLVRGPEPARRPLRVARVHGSPGEHDVAGKKPALPAAPEHEHLDTTGPGPGRDHGRRGPDLLVVGSTRRILAGAGGRGPPSPSASSPFTGASPRLPWERMEDVERRIRDAIGDRGPITFAEFMELALYSPGAFYDTLPWARKPTS